MGESLVPEDVAVLLEVLLVDELLDFVADEFLGGRVDLELVLHSLDNLLKLYALDLLHQLDDCCFNHHIVVLIERG